VLSLLFIATDYCLSQLSYTQLLQSDLECGVSSTSCCAELKIHRTGSDDFYWPPSLCYGMRNLAYICLCGTCVTSAISF
jgi:hypothetical protein